MPLPDICLIPALLSTMQTARLFLNCGFSPELKDACYLSLSKHLGASLIVNREIITGKHGHNSTIEHVQMEPKGRLCYCGKHGCMETLCSLDALLNDGETLDSFFTKVRNKTESENKRWQEYLSHLARSINLLHLIYDQDFILGGYLAPYLQEKRSFLYS